MKCFVCGAKDVPYILVQIPVGPYKTKTAAREREFGVKGTDFPVCLQCIINGHQGVIDKVQGQVLTK